MPNKPRARKLFVLCDSSGYVYCFEIYSGAGDDNVVLPGCPDRSCMGIEDLILNKEITNSKLSSYLRSKNHVEHSYVGVLQSRMPQMTECHTMEYYDMLRNSDVV